MQTAVNTSVKITPTLHSRIQNLAQARASSTHALMLQAIEKFVEREEKREALRQEAFKAHEEFALTGLHLTGQEVDTWLAELEAGNDVEPPKCHI